MNMKLTWLVAGIGLLLCAYPCIAGDGTIYDSAAYEKQSLALRDCYQLALKRSETIAIQSELLKETEGRFMQALSGVLPKISFVSSDKRQDGTGTSAFTLDYIPERKFTLSQPLFSGFKEFAAMAGSRAEKRQHNYEKARAEQLLLADVSNAFYLLIEAREDLAALETIRSALSERIDELKDRERLGRSRQSEVVSAASQLARVDADVEQARGKEVTAIELLEFLTGLEHIETLHDEDYFLPSLEPEDSYLAKTDLRPDVRAAKEAWHVASKQVTIARAKFFPTVSVEGNSYTKRVGVSQDIDWDATLKVDVPIFQGGQNAGALRESASQARQAKLRWQETQRKAALDIRNVYATLRAALDRASALEKAREAAQENYRLQKEDYRLNLVDNLDVLQALQSLENARRDVISVRYEAKRLFWQLRVAVGESI